MLEQMYPVVFGILQGMFEWLPISSQGNLVIIMINLLSLNAQDALNLAIFLHTGTLFSVIVYFRRDLRHLLWRLGKYKPGFGSEEDSLITFLIISTIFTGLVGYPIYKVLTASEFTGEVFLGLIGISLIASGVIQKFSDFGRGLYRKLNLTDSVLLGLLQGISAVPGISRSGITVSGFLLRNYSSEHALKYSFIMSIPAVLAAEIGLGLMGGLPAIPPEHALLGILSSFFVGLVSIHVLLKVARRIKFWIFCIMIGIITLLPLAGYMM